MYVATQPIKVRSATWNYSLNQHACIFWAPLALLFQATTLSGRKSCWMMFMSSYCFPLHRGRSTKASNCFLLGLLSCIFSFRLAKVGKGLAKLQDVVYVELLFCNALREKLLFECAHGLSGISHEIPETLMSTLKLKHALAISEFSLIPDPHKPLCIYIQCCSWGSGIGIQLRKDWSKALYQARGEMRCEVR